MSRFTLMENLPDLVIASTTTVTMASSYLGKPTRITCGGQQLLYTTTTTLNFATTGLNALDTGAIAANTLYYIYSVKSSGGVAGLVASTAAPATGPTGYTAWREIGRCRTLQSAATLATITNRVGGTSSLTLGGSEWQSFTPTVAGNGSKIFTNYAKWRRVGSEMELRVYLSGNTTASGGGATDFTFTMPSGYNRDLNAMPTTSLQNGGNVYGYANVYGVLSAGNLDYTAEISGGATNSTFSIWKPGSTGSFTAADLNVARLTEFYCKLSIPIAEFAGLYT